MKNKTCIPHNFDRSISILYVDFEKDLDGQAFDLKKFFSLRKMSLRLTRSQSLIPR
jgi:hypothetical protein